MKANVKTLLLPILLLFIALYIPAVAQDQLLSIDRIYSGEFVQAGLPAYQWMPDGESYAVVEQDDKGQSQIILYTATSGKRRVLVDAEELQPAGQAVGIGIADFSLSADGSKMLVFTNTSKVWRANTKGDYWVLDLESRKLQQLGSGFPSSSLMFAKFDASAQKVAYVHDFNIYIEDLQSHRLEQLTQREASSRIHGTFDWAYEEEFGARDGFRWSPDAQKIAYWSFDISEVGTFYMINNTDSIYSKPIPLQYPKVGQNPSAVKIGIIGLEEEETLWLEIPGIANQNFLPGMQWVNEDQLLIQQLNRHQNKLTIWKYTLSTKSLTALYTEEEDTWVDIYYPDISAPGWEENDLLLVNDNAAFLRMTETDGWRHVYEVSIEDGKQTLLSPTEFDVASIAGINEDYLYFHASPKTSSQRYLYQVSLGKDKKVTRVTPDLYPGINTYDFAPGAKVAIHRYEQALAATHYQVVLLPKHEPLRILEDNQAYQNKLHEIDLPEVQFFSIAAAEDLEMEGRMILPTNFDENKSYPVLFHVYGEPWGAVATDNFIGLWNIMMAQKGYIIIDMDNRGTPSLKGSAWRKSIYRQVGQINADDQAAAAKAVLKKYDFIDPSRVAVWGWSGGGSMTQNLLFRYPDLYQTGIAVAGVSLQLIYDNIYQERYMGLPNENLEDFLVGSPISHVAGLKGNLLLIHGTADDNVHYQSMDLLVNELIRQNKQFDMMAYPNRSHGIYEGENTRKHLYTLISNYLLKNTAPN
ncbi:peptidase S9 [Echinicola pacifica]|uniref:Peptidase S9 n=1 Tax=Echinicola pacifica TaxID=346377 RepID=A0A918ULY7_9BACT|nr:DPP IV N-terminal domain-containing protein [Echinicola pacifica]GGZ19885.1 peptidase S9 [Echinicola pacifica]